MNFKPTRKANILDLVIVSNKDSIHKVEIKEPMWKSDHDTVDRSESHSKAEEQSEKKNKALLQSILRRNGG